MVWDGLRSLDRVLRGDATRPATMGRGMVDVPVGPLSGVALVLAGGYGACVGAFALVGRLGTPRLGDGLLQMASSAVKVPLLLVLTLGVTCPSLYVFNALLGSRLTVASVVRLLAASVAVLAAVLASFGTILVFFSLCTESYAFIVLLNVVLFAVSGGLGLGFLLQTLHRLASVPPPPGPPPEPAAVPAGAAADPVAAEPPPPGVGPAVLELRDPDPPRRRTPDPTPSPGPLDRLDPRRELRSVRRVFRVWVLVFGLVGAQMSWVLRPFVLAPGSTFAVFRHRESNFFSAVFAKLSDLTGEATPARHGRGW